MAILCECSNELHVILFQNWNFDNRYDINNKYNLLISKNYKEFMNCLKTIKEEKVKTDFNSYMKYEFGNPIELVSNKILV